MVGMAKKEKMMIIVAQLVYVQNTNLYFLVTFIRTNENTESKNAIPKFIAGKNEI